MSEPRNLVYSASRAGVEIKDLEGWWSLEQVAELWGYTRAGVAYFIFNSGRINIDRDIRKVTTKGIMLMRITKANEIKRQMDAEGRLKADLNGTRP